MKKPNKLPRDMSQRAKAIVDLSTGGDIPSEGGPVKKKTGATKKATPARRKRKTD